MRVCELVDAKKTDTRAEHVSATITIGSSAQIVASSTEDENADVSTQSPTSFLSVKDALLNQPSDTPAKQRAIADQIMFAATMTDDRVWAFEEQRLTPEGWRLSYLCSGSMTAWKREHGKEAEAVAGDCNKLEPNAGLLSRPAFDCRGSITVSFLEKERVISVELNHTPLHKTVGELFAIHKPPPRPAPPPQTARPKTKGKDRTGTKEGGDGTSKPRAQRRRSKRARTAEAQLVLVDKGDEAPGGADVDPALREAMQQVTFAVGGTQAAVSTQTEPSSTMGSNGKTGAPPVLSLNLSPEEAARRKEAANKILAAAGVDPATLSTDQFSIFSNQSPDLQKESLAMLAKYGAERLRIVHPTEDNSSAPSATPADALGKAAECQPKNSATPSKNSRTKVGLSRLACLRCKLRRVKCPKERPACTECVSNGVACEYPPTAARKKQPSSTAEGDGEVDGDAEGEETMDVVETQEVTEIQETERAAEDSTQYSYPQPGDVQQKSGSTPDVQQLPYFQSGPGMSWQQPPDSQYPASYQPSARPTMGPSAPRRRQLRPLSDVWSPERRPSPLEQHLQHHQQLQQQQQDKDRLQRPQHAQQYPPATVAPAALQSRHYLPNSSDKLQRGKDTISYQ